MTGSHPTSPSTTELIDSLTGATATLRAVGFPGAPFGAVTRIEEAQLLRAIDALVAELGVQLRAREIVTEEQVMALVKPTRQLADVLAGPDLECECQHPEPKDHRSDGCAWTHPHSGVGCDCDKRGGGAPTATRIWLEPRTSTEDAF